jgi:hypothetical protein
MHIQHLAVMFGGWCRALLVIVRLLEDCKGIGGSALFEIHVHDDGDVDEGMFVQLRLAGLEGQRLTLVFSTSTSLHERVIA